MLPELQLGYGERLFALVRVLFNLLIFYFESGELIGSIDEMALYVAMVAIQFFGVVIRKCIVSLFINNWKIK